jgi:acyl-coenzyme A synthetase/AMP-(fatty) acid ligase
VSDATTRALDDAFIDMVADWREGGAGCDDALFEAHALALYAYQIERNEPYRRYAASLGFDATRLPQSWREIPAAPASAFKDAALATFDLTQAELVFHTSGTSAEQTGTHYVEHARLYDASLLASFDRFMLADRAKLRYLNLVPNPRWQTHSSLGYMMGHVSVLRGEGKAAYFLDNDRVDVAGFERALEAAIAERQAVCIAGTAFAFAALLEALEADARSFVAPEGSRIMETGGFKGRTRAIERTELYRRLEASLGIAQAAIVAEYGMTELLSQYYDAPESRASDLRVKVGPPWLRAVVVDENGREVPAGETGLLRHVDLANRSSVVAIDTEDRGYVHGPGFVLLGRDSDARARGCSLDAEDLVRAPLSR